MVKLAQLGTALVSDNSLHGINGDGMSIITDLSDTHEVTGDCGNLEHKT